MDYVILENDRLRLQVAHSFGPRILSLHLDNGPNLLAELPEVRAIRPDKEIYRFYGGHRLWLAPEDPIRSYSLDDQAVDISQTGKGLLIRKKVEPETGIEKSICIALSDSGAKLTLTHSLVNKGPAAVEWAPWAITMLRKGGVAILPQARTPTGLLPNRLLVLWPYTDISSANVTWGNNFIIVHGEQQPAFKIGFPNPRGWLGYWQENCLFIKRAHYDAQWNYSDFGSSSECYCNHQFLELETLGPLCTLAPGEPAVHIESWELYANVHYPDNEATMQAIVENIGLE